MKKASGLFYFCKFISQVVLKTGWGLTGHGLENLPQKGPVIIASNHRSYADPPIIGSVVPRVFHFLAKKELFDFKPFGWFITKLNAHPLNRASGITALRAAQEILDENGVVILFPEGRRSPTDQLLKPKSGVGMLALKTGVPVVPAYIHNSGHLKEFYRVSVHFGPPLNPKKFDNYDKLAEEVMTQIQKLKDQIQAKI